jgi:hypothetical protein
VGGDVSSVAEAVDVLSPRLLGADSGFLSVHGSSKGVAWSQKISRDVAERGGGVVGKSLENTRRRAVVLNRARW